MMSEALQRKVKSGSLICGALLAVLFAVLCPCSASAGIPSVWSDVTTVNLAMGESKSFSNVTYHKLFRVIVPGTIMKEQDKVYFRISSLSSGSGATVKLYAKSSMYVNDGDSRVGIDTENALVWQRTDYGGGYDQLLPENTSLQDKTYYLNVRDVTCTVTFSRPLKQYVVEYRPGAYANESSVQKDSMLIGSSLKLRNEIFTRAGYTQTGWAKTDGGMEVYALGATYSANKDVALYPVWTPNAEPPTKPSVSVSTSASTGVNITWSGGIGATSFSIFRSTSNVRPDAPLATNVVSPYFDDMADSGLKPGVEYYYWVGAFNSEGSAYSDAGRCCVAAALSLDKSTDSHAAGGGSGSVSVSANASWMAMTDADWITFGTKSGNGDGTLTYTVAANALTSSRTGMVIVVAGADTDAPATKMISVVQDGVSTQDFVIVDGVLTEYVGAGGAVTIPEGVTHIGTCAFLVCSGLESVTMPSSVVSVGEGAFAFCDGLTSVKMSPSVESIGNYAFSECGGLESVTIPPSVRSIGNRAFMGCKSLTSVSIPSGVTNIEDYAFGDCDGLTDITVKVDNVAYCSLDGILYDKTVFSLIQCPAGKSGAVTIPAGVRNIGVRSFAACTGITSVEIPSSVGIIGQSAFLDCRGLVSMKIPSSVGHVAEDAFSGCTGLTAVTIAEGVRSIGERAFEFCRGLKTVTIPSSMASIGQDAFDRCLFLTVVHVSNNGDIDAVRRMLSASGFNVNYLTFDHKEEPCEVVFDAKDGAGTMPSLQMSPGCVYLLTPCTFTPPAGKRFAGWACSNGRRYDDGMLVFDLAKPGETVTMTAIWE